MGADKAFLKFGNTTLLERAVGIAKLTADAVYICGPREKFGPEAIEDIFPDCGPLGGIHAALKSSQSELNLVLAVDLPFVEADFLKYLLCKTEINPDSLSDNRETGVRSFTMPLRTENRELRTSALTAVVPRAARGWQPLCALYRKAFAETAEKALREKRYKIDSLFDEVPVRPVEEVEILQAGFSLRIFDNLNTPQDFNLAQQRLP